jgi:hypothetical protein
MTSSRPMRSPPAVSLRRSESFLASFWRSLRFALAAAAA